MHPDRVLSNFNNINFNQPYHNKPANIHQWDSLSDGINQHNMPPIGEHFDTLYTRIVTLAVPVTRFPGAHTCWELTGILKYFFVCE